MIDRRATTLTITFALLAGLASQAMAQTKPLRQSILEYGLDTGLLDNVAARSRVVFEQTLDMGDVPWMRIEFATVRLTRQSHIILESLADGAVQTLNARNMARWGQTSAYFNGGLVQLTVVASQRSFDNRVRIERVQVGQWLDPNVQERQCGPTDDRVSSTEPERGRLLAVGCTATIYDPNSCLITAGHCLASGSLVNVLEFNVPPSLADGTIQHPGPEDQYAVVASSRRFLSAGVGNDWGLFKVSPNSETGLMPFEAQGAHLTLADTTPDTPGLQLNIVGYGTDVGPDNLTQQIADGPIVSLSRNQLAYEIDTEGGNSGSTVVSVSTRVKSWPSIPTAAARPPTAPTSERPSPIAGSNGPWPISAHRQAPSFAPTSADSWPSASPTGLS